MNKAIVAVSITAVALIAGTAFAQMGGMRGGSWMMGYGGSGGMGSGMGYGNGAYENGSDRSPNAQNESDFQKAALGFQDGLQTKQVDLENEYKKPASNPAYIQELSRQITIIRAKIQKTGEKFYLSAQRQELNTGYYTGPGMIDGHAAAY